jgi:hypothetical protein
MPNAAGKCWPVHGCCDSLVVNAGVPSTSDCLSRSSRSGMRSSAAPRGISGSWWRLVSKSAMILVMWVATQVWRWWRLAVSRSWGLMAHSRVGDYTVITTAGDLDVETAAALRDAIGVVVEAGQRQGRGPGPGGLP